MPMYLRLHSCKEHDLVQVPSCPIIKNYMVLINEPKGRKSREGMVCLVCMSGSVDDKHHLLFDCSTYSDTRQQYSHLFHQASSSVATFLITDQLVATHYVRLLILILVLHKDNLCWPDRF
jgi:hypothetical protein